jgi:hypothetical protein
MPWQATQDPAIPNGIQRQALRSEAKRSEDACSCRTARRDTGGNSEHNSDVLERKLLRSYSERNAAAFPSPYAPQPWESLRPGDEEKGEPGRAVKRRGQRRKQPPPDATARLGHVPPALRLREIIL